MDLVIKEGAYFIYEVNGNDSGDMETRNGPYLKIIQHPTKELGFRYKSALQNLRKSPVRKSKKRQYPTVQLFNFDGPAVISCTLYTEDYQIHAYSLMRKGKLDPHFIPVGPENGYCAVFSEMVVINSAQKNLSEDLKSKFYRIFDSTEESYILPDDNQEIKDYIKNMKLNVVRLAFEAFVKGEDGNLISITDKVFSNSISNKKSSSCNELKICRMNLFSGSPLGGNEMILFVEKVIRNNIQVRFFEVDNKGKKIWEDFGRFTSIDVHRQYAIALKTPPYKDVDITEAAQVFIELFRPSDQNKSFPKIFKYLPQHEYDECDSKRLKLDENDFIHISGSLTGQLSINSDTDNSDFLEYQECLALFDAEFKRSFKQNRISIGQNRNKNRKRKLNSDTNILKDIIVELNRERKPRAVLKPLIDKIFVREPYNNTSALFAAIHIDHAKLKLLFEILSHYCKYSKKHVESHLNNHGQTILHVAVKLNLIDITRYLIETLKIDPNLQDNESNSAFHMAFTLPKKYCLIHLEQLLKSKHSLIPNVANSDGLTPLHLALEKGCIRSFELLLDEEDPFVSRKSDGSNCLHLAVMQNSLKAARLILQKNKSGINMKNVLGLTPAFYAVTQKNDEMCKLLIDYGAHSCNVNLEDDLLNNGLIIDENEGFNQQIVILFAENEQNILKTVEVRTIDPESSNNVDHVFFTNLNSEISTHSELPSDVDIQNYFHTFNPEEFEEVEENQE